MTTVLEVETSAHYNVDSNTVKVQIYITDPCDNYYHSDAVISGSVQLYNVYNVPATGLEEVRLEIIEFSSADANEDGIFAIFFVNPAVSTNLEAETILDITGQGEITDVVTVLADAGTFTDQPSTSVVGNAVNRSWHLDPEKERDEPYQDVAPHSPIELNDDQIVVPDPIIVNSINADIQFEQLAEILSDGQLPGSLVYLGGGGRLLPKPGSFVFQETDTPPWELGASTFTEQGSIQLSPNNSYVGSTSLASGAGSVPTGYTMDSAGITIVNSKLSALQGTGYTAKAWSIQVNGANQTSANTASIGITSPVAFDKLQPIALSLLAGLEKVALESDITEAKLILNFFDYANRALPSKSVAVSVTDLFNARPLIALSIEAQPSEFPLSTEKFTWRLEITSVDPGDYIQILTALPSVTYTPFATSQVLTSYTRTADDISFVPETAFEMEEGAAVFSLALSFTGAPTETKWIFDTRDSVNLNNGVALRVNADGTLTLLVQNATTTSSVTTPTATAWVAGAVVEVVAEWSNATPLMQISVDGTTLVTDTSTALPTGMTLITAPVIQLGANAQALEALDGEIIRATFLKRPR
jgi:hypothetical protein